jgi:2-furoyl-CoA dehydrogenase FAD binding subunit
VKPAPFAYASPDSLVEALQLLNEFGSEARVLAGGQTLGPMLNMRIATPSLLIDINRLRELPAPTASAGTCVTAALYRQGRVFGDRALAESVPLLRQAMPFVGHYQTRTRGTICGSIAHADPTAELPLVLLTLGGWVHLASTKTTRKVAARDFFLGVLTTDRRPDEMITSVEWPAARPDQRFAFREIGAHRSHAALCGSAVAARVDAAGIVRELSIGLTAIADRPMLLDTWPFLNVRPDDCWRAEIAQAIRQSLTFASDLHASADYRRHVAGVLVARCLDEITAKTTANAEKPC